ncbi:MAG: DUF4091 domain-containing protein [Cephaloticoccus sp.]|nr:DUF4091 domain-containing protein [Cephaloticoccus sp.]MCF7761221.1 DUF4091 domain-containing protein [Cephaloticoccus sp.]
MKWSIVVALGLPLALFAAAPSEAPTVPFAARHEAYEPLPPLLTDADHLDVLRGATLTASGHDEEQRPEFVHDGTRDDTVMFWTSKDFPAWVKLELPEAREIAQVDLQLRAPGTRSFNLAIEGSDDGTHWNMLYDRLAGTGVIPGGRVSVVLPEPIKISALRLTITGGSKPNEGPYVQEISAFARPTTNALEGGVGDIDHRYDGSNVPLAGHAQSWHATAWRGERVHGQFVIWTSGARTGLRAEVSGLHCVENVGRGLRTPPIDEEKAGSGIPALQANMRFVRNVLAEGKLTGDVLDDARRVDMPAGSYRAVWLTVETPRDAVPGNYSGTLTLRADGTEPKEFPLSLEVLPATLPAPADWRFHLDIWQHPWAIARWHDVEPWSEEHFRLMRPYMIELAHAGQKVITTTITPRPWGSRDYHDYDTMVDHLRQTDGSWKFDYTVFDRYVEFAMSCGITRQINCYSMLTWSGRLEYTDAATGDRRVAMCEPGSAEFADYWGPFLKDFEQHLINKGWLEITRLGVDEAPAEMMRSMLELVRTNAPQLKAALAGNSEPSHYTGLDLADFTIILDHASDDLLRDIAQRRAEGRITTFYVCLDPKRPNTFVTSPPAESVWLGYYTVANGFDGMLRWAYTTWPENPFVETLYSCHPWRRDLPPGDEFMIYPGPRSSIRWELMRDGIEEAEKLRLLREANDGEIPAEIAQLLERFRDPKQLGDDATIIRDVGAMRAAIAESSRALPEKE